ncbi:MAG: hypothetical protein ABI402_12140 [Ferruginibacter sp.]
MKNISAKLLLTVFLLTQLLSLCWYLYKPLSHAWFETIHEIKHAWTGNQNKIITITFDRSEFQKLQSEDDEIVIDGMRYDIERSVIKGNKITLSLEYDFAETQSDHHFDQLGKQLQKYPGTASTTNSVNRNAFFVFFFSKPPITNHFEIAVSKKNYRGIIDNNYSEYFPGCINPPPEYL